MLEVYSGALLHVLVGSIFGIIGSCVHIWIFISKKKCKLSLVRVIQGAIFGHVAGVFTYGLLNKEMLIFSIVLTAVIGLLIGIFGLLFVRHVEKKIEEQGRANTNIN